MERGETVHIDGNSLTVDQVDAVARRNVRVELDPAASVRGRIEESYRLNRDLMAQGLPIYGVTTGVGDSVALQFAADRASGLQHALVRQLGCGTGPVLGVAETRAAVLVRANCLAKGFSGVRPLVVERLLDMLNLDLMPRIPEQGSLGASGDLIPGSYIAAALVGERQVLLRGDWVPASQAWEALGKEPLVLEPKEGLALLNGTMVTAGLACLNLLDATRVAVVADVCTALACQALCALTAPFDAFVHQVKPYPGQVRSARLIRSLLEGSAWARPYQETVDSLAPLEEGAYRELEVRIQDNYSLRCAPQCTGALYDTVDWVHAWVGTEINSTNDNPIYDLERRQVTSGGNFSGFHLGLAMDSLKVAVASVCDLLDRQLALLVDEKFNHGLPPNLVVDLGRDHPERGIYHGFKGMQLAMSALTAEALHHSTPASVFSRSTECHNQDKVSMATMAARQARDTIEMVERCCAIHLLASCQALDLRMSAGGGPGPGGGGSVGSDLDSLGRSRTVYQRVRQVSPFVDRDRPLEEDIACVVKLLRCGELLAGIG